MSEVIYGKKSPLPPRTSLNQTLLLSFLHGRLVGILLIIRSLHDLTSLLDINGLQASGNIKKY